MVYGELDVLPLQIAIDKRIIAYWARQLSKHDSAYSYCLYRMELTLFTINHNTKHIGYEKWRAYLITVDSHTCGITNPHYITIHAII